MAVSPEIEKTQVKPESGTVTERPETIDVPKELEQGGVIAKPSQITAQVSDQGGKPMMQSPATQTVTVTLPTSPKKLVNWSQGSTDDSLTWLGWFWLRMIKKALHFGWRVVKKGGKPNAV